MRISAKVLCLSGLLLIAADLSLAQSSMLNFTEYAIPTSKSQPYGIVAGPDGALWFTENQGNKIGRITTAGEIIEYGVPTADSAPWGIAVGPDGALWFTEACGNNIGRITTAGAITEYHIPAPYAVPIGIAAGPDGALWFTEYGAPSLCSTGANGIGRITTAGVITDEYNLPYGPGNEPIGITTGPDGALWFSIYIEIGRLTTSGSFDVYRIDSAWSGWITSGPDGALWDTQSGEIVRMTTQGIPTIYKIPNGYAQGIVAVPDGRLWFADEDGRVGRKVHRAMLMNTPCRPITATRTASPWGRMALCGLPKVWATRLARCPLSETALMSLAPPEMLLTAFGRLWLIRAYNSWWFKPGGGPLRVPLRKTNLWVTEPRLMARRTMA